jgi:hypothetical protein
LHPKHLVLLGAGPHAYNARRLPENVCKKFTGNALKDYLYSIVRTSKGFCPFREKYLIRLEKEKGQDQVGAV